MVKGGISNWPAVKKWQDINYLKNIIGDDFMKVYVSLDENFEHVVSFKSYKELLRRHNISTVDIENTADDEELFMVRPAETEFKFKDFLQMSKNNNQDGTNFYLQKFDIRNWKNTALFDDLLPNFHSKETELGRNKDNQHFAKFLKLTYHLMWLSTSSDMTVSCFMNTFTLYICYRKGQSIMMDMRICMVW